MSGDTFKDYTENEIKKDGRRKTGMIMLGPGILLIAASIALPLISEELGLVSWGVCGLGFVLFFGGLIAIVTNLKKKPPKMESGMGLDDL